MHSFWMAPGQWELRAGDNRAGSGNAMVCSHCLETHSAPAQPYGFNEVCHSTQLLGHQELIWVLNMFFSTHINIFGFLSNSLRGADWPTDLHLKIHTTADLSLESPFLCGGGNKKNITKWNPNLYWVPILHSSYWRTLQMCLQVNHCPPLNACWDNWVTVLHGHFRSTSATWLETQVAPGSPWQHPFHTRCDPVGTHH